MNLLGLKSIVVNASQLLGGRLLTQAFRGIYVVVLARSLGPEVYGLFAYGQSWYMAFLPITILGLGAVLSREVGRDREGGGKVVARALTLRTLSAIVGAVACAVVGWHTDANLEARQLLLIFSVALAGRGLATWAEQVFVAYESSRYTLQQEAIFRPLEVTVGLFVLSSGGGGSAVALVHALIWWLQAARGWFLVHRRLVPLKSEWSRAGLTTLLVQGMPLCLSALISGWLLQGPLVLFRHLAESETTLGQFALAIQALMLLFALPWSISMAALPVLSRAAAREDGKVFRFVEGMLRGGFLIGAIAGLSGMEAGPWLVEMLFGERYGLAGQLLGPALWLLIPLTAGTAVAQVLIARGRLGSLILCSFAGALGMTLALPPLVLAIGAWGALGATGAGLMVYASSLIAILARSGSLDLGLAVLRPGIAALLACAGYLSLGSVSDRLALPGSLIVLFGGALAFGVLVPEERSALKSFLK